MQTMLNMQHLGTPMGSLCPSPIGRWAPSNSWSQAAWPCPHPYSLAYQLLPTQHGDCFSLCPSFLKGSAWAFLPICLCPLPKTLIPAGGPLLSMAHLDIHLQTSDR